MMGKSFNLSLVVGQDVVRGRVRGRDAGLMESLTFFGLVSSNIAGERLRSTPEFSRITPFQGKILCIAAAGVCEC